MKRRPFIEVAPRASKWINTPLSGSTNNTQDSSRMDKIEKKKTETGKLIRR